MENVSKKETKVLYLHGLGSSPKKDGVLLLKKYNIISPKLDYESGPAFDSLVSIIEKEKIRAIIGHSIGGYLSYYLSNYMKIPCLIFNPAFKDEDLKFQPVKENVKKYKPFEFQMAVIGIYDDEIPKKTQTDSLKGTMCKVFYEKIGHDIPFKIKQKYINKFFEDFNLP